MTKSYDIIQGPIITEKTIKLKEDFNKYTFKVNKTANKIEIKNAVEEIFKVKVLSVNTVNVLPKRARVGQYIGFKPAYKKAIVKLADGDKIAAFEI
ncbi:MAG: 50S ribosomal protein L23 [Acholeplasmatales bacterium]|nr:50S ribosomal protein L23 [Acholeplasmatales bacterium]